jgi:hypothetical protein
MKAKEFIPATKPRNFVVKNQKTAGAGAHKDKKRAEKQGDVKHKQKQFDEEAAGVGIVTKQNATVDVPVGGEYMNVKKLFPKKKKVKEQGVAEGSAHGYNVAKWYEKNGDQKKLTNWLRKEAGLEKNAPLYFDDVDLVHGDQTIVPGALINPKLKFNDLLTAVVQATGGTPKQKVDGVYRSQGVEERVRDPEDWDEGNTEPPNNFAVYINGKKWKVFKGRGQFADDYKEREHYRQLQNWAQAKSQSTGKKWEISVTGESPTA